MSIVHFYSSYVTNDGDALRRHMVAGMTWRMQGWLERPVLDAELPRAWRESGKALPYLKDVYDIATKDLADDDIAVMSNTDTCVISQCAMKLAADLQALEAVWGHRRDFYHPFTKPIPDADVHKGQVYPGYDIFAFRVRWWRDWGHEFPDLLLGMEGWDPCMMTLMVQSQDGKDCEVKDYCYHEKHNSFWESNRYNLQAQRWNLKNEIPWLVSLGVDPNQFGMRLF